MKRVNVFLQDDVWEVLKIRAVQKQQTLTSYINDLLIAAHDSILKKGLTTEVAPIEMTKVYSNSDTREAYNPGKIIYPIKSTCKNCGLLKMVTPHEFIFGYEQERITDNLCDNCWKKAQQDGTAR